MSFNQLKKDRVCSVCGVKPTRTHNDSRCNSCVYQSRKKRHAEAGRIWRESNPASFICNKAKSRAKRKNIPYDLDFKLLHIPTHCPVLGLELDYKQGHKGGKAADNSPSLDRIIPGLGYINSNVRVISHRANYLKNNASVEEMRAILRDLEHITC